MTGRAGCLALLLLTGLGCARKTVSTTVSLPDSTRSYLLTTGREHDAKRPAPVLFALHAYATKPGVVDDALDLREVVVEERGFILVTPNGHLDSKGNPFWNATRACCDGDRTEPNDVAYLRRTLSDVKRRYAVDDERVYAVGVSNGAFMAHRWACEPGGDLAAIIGISGVGPGKPDPPCRPSRPVDVVQIHGDADDIVRYEGGRMNDFEHPSVPDTVAAWAALDGCAPGSAPARGEWHTLGLNVVTETHHCPQASVTLWRVLGGAHNLRLRAAPFERALLLVDRTSRP